MTAAVLITLVGVLMVLVSSEPTAAHGRHRAPGMRRLRPVEARLHLADGTVDDTPLESGSRWILVRDGHRARMVST